MLAERSGADDSTEIDNGPKYVILLKNNGPGGSYINPFGGTIDAISSFIRISKDNKYIFSVGKSNRRLINYVSDINQDPVGKKSKAKCISKKSRNEKKKSFFQ